MSIHTQRTLSSICDLLVIYECSFVNTILNIFVVMQMARPNRSAIEMFAVQLDLLPESVSDPNGNDNYVPKEDFIGEWTALPEKTSTRSFLSALYLQAGNDTGPARAMGADEDLGSRVH